MILALLLACQTIAIPADTWIDLDNNSPDAEEADLFYAQVTGYLYAWNDSTFYHQSDHISRCNGVATAWEGMDLSEHAPVWMCLTSSEGETYRLQVSDEILNSSGRKVMIRLWP